MFKTNVLAGGVVGPKSSATQSTALTTPIHNRSVIELLVTVNIINLLLGRVAIGMSYYTDTSDIRLWLTLKAF